MTPRQQSDKNILLPGEIFELLFKKLSFVQSTNLFLVFFCQFLHSHCTNF